MPFAAKHEHYPKPSEVWKGIKTLQFINAHVHDPGSVSFSIPDKRVGREGPVIKNAEHSKAPLEEWFRGMRTPLDYSGKVIGHPYPDP